MATSDIITGQFVRLEQTPASIGDRIIARIIDGTAIGVYTIAMIFLFIYMPPYSIGFNSWGIAAYYIIALLPVFAYTFLCEWLFKGQTLGKYIMKTRVVMADGSRPTVGALLIRWLLEAVDIYFSFVGIIPIIITRRHQRLGDLAAGTMVVREPDAKEMHIPLTEFAYARADYVPTYPNAGKLSLAQADVIADILEQADKSHQIDRNKITKLSAKVEKVLSLPPQEKPLSFLRTVLNDYRYYAAQII